MSFDCKYKVKDGQCLKIKKECSPGDKGCILHGKFEFPFKEETVKQKKSSCSLQDVSETP